MDIDVKNLHPLVHPLEVRLLRHVSAGEDITPERIIQDLDYKVGQSNQAFSWLTAKGLVEEKSRSHRISYELTEFGRSEQLKGLPAERIFAFITENGPHTLPEIADALSLEKSDVGSAFGLLSSKGSAKMNDEKKAEAASSDLPAEVQIQRSLLDRAAGTGFIDEGDLSAEEKKAIGALAKKRGAQNSAFRIVERDEIVYALTADGEKAKKALVEANITGEEFGILTPEMIQTGSWKNGTFRPYGINAPTSRLIPGRRNAYSSYLRFSCLSSILQEISMMFTMSRIQSTARRSTSHGSHRLRQLTRMDGKPVQEDGDIHSIMSSQGVRF